MLLTKRVAWALDLLGRVDVLVPVPEPLVSGVLNVPQAEDPHCLSQPGGENAIEHDRLAVRLLDADGFEVGLMIEPPRRVVVAAGVGRRDVVRHVQAAGGLGPPTT